MNKQTDLSDHLSASALASSPFLKVLLDERTVMAVIGINAVALFLHGFIPHEGAAAGQLLFGQVLFYIDYACLLYFILELIFKLKVLGRAEYFRNAWNTFDFAIVLASLPTLLLPLGFGADFAFLTVLRTMRLLRFLRFMRFIPSLPRLMDGAKRALRSSIGIMMVLVLYNFIFGLASFHFFGPTGMNLPEFEDPLTSMYTMFKIFTIEGWYEVGDNISAELPPLNAHLVRIYFIAAVVTGGLIILGLLNAVIVDEMSNDLAKQTEEDVEEVANDISLMRADIVGQLKEISARLDRIERG